MKLTEEDRKQIVLYRIEKAKSTLCEAKDNIELENWNTVANRLYYACYYAASALLIKHEYFSKTHEGVNSLLGQHFIKTGIIDPKHGSTYSKTLALRQKGDYNDMVIIDPDQVKQLATPTEELITTIENLISSQP
ncbi:MAG: HEPN domain-containing protein [Bacteroidales bacterium]|nr:HEPN domain-containing protein [Bacteroidales bacterium]